MAFVLGRCPNCGGEIQLDESKEQGFCLHCGSSIQVREAVALLKVEHTGSVNLQGIATDQSLVDYGYSILETQPKEAEKQFREALKISPQSWRAWNGCANALLRIKPRYLNKPLNTFLSSDITENDIDFPCQYDDVTVQAQPVKILRRSGGISGARYTFFALLGTNLLTGISFDEERIYDWKTEMSGIRYVTENEYCNEPKFFVPLANALEKAIQYAPIDENDKLAEMKARFVDYPRKMYALLLESTKRLQEQQVISKQKGICPHCGSKLKKSGPFSFGGITSYSCKSCGYFSS